MFSAELAPCGAAYVGSTDHVNLRLRSIILFAYCSANESIDAVTARNLGTL